MTYRNRPKNRPSGPTFLPFFIILIIFGSIFGGAVGLLFELLPHVIIFGIVFSLIKSISNNKKDNTVKTEKKVNKAYLSNAKRNKIDNKLSKYFKDNYRLPVYDDIYLTTKNGTYTSFEELYIAKGDELIISLNEYGNNFNETYNEIVSLLSTFANQNTVETQEKKEDIKVNKNISPAQKYIDEINNLNVDIAKEEIKSGLYQTCALLKQIDLSATDNDDDKIHKLYDYYLPILVKILTNYKSLMNVSKDSNDFKESENQLIKTIILINEALKNINESLHEDDYMDLSADITTLQSLLKKDGLVNSGTIYEKDINDDQQK